MEQQIQARIKQLQEERAGVANRIAAMEQEIAQGRHLLSAYDGAIGELSLLLEQATVEEE